MWLDRLVTAWRQRAARQELSPKSDAVWSDQMDTMAGTHLARTIGRVHSCFCLRGAQGDSASCMISCGYWDNKIRQHELGSAQKAPRPGSTVAGHEGSVTCLGLAEGGDLLVTGGEDATVRVWVVSNPTMAAALLDEDGGGVRAGDTRHLHDSMTCVHVLYGHEAPVLCLAVSEVRILPPAVELVEFDSSNDSAGGQLEMKSE